MRSFQEAAAEFQATYGAEAYLFLNSPLWRAARAFLIEQGPNRKLIGLPPEAIQAYGAIFAANIQGFQDVLETIELLFSPAGREPGEIAATYLPEIDEFMPGQRPAPEPPTPERKKKK